MIRFFLMLTGGLVFMTDMANAGECRVAGMTSNPFNEEILAVFVQRDLWETPISMNVRVEELKRIFGWSTVEGYLYPCAPDEDPVDAFRRHIAKHQ